MNRVKAGTRRRPGEGDMKVPSSDVVRMTQEYESWTWNPNGLAIKCEGVSHESVNS